MVERRVEHEAVLDGLVIERPEQAVVDIQAEKQRS
jgi:hypothetical protein